MSTKTNLIIFALLLILALPANAQDSDKAETIEPTPKGSTRGQLPPRPNPEDDLRTKRDQLREDAMERKEEVRDTIKDKRDDIRDTMIEKKGEMMEKAGDIRERMRTMMSSDKDFAGVPEKLREKIIDQKEKFAEKLEKFKDEKKKELAEKIEEQIQKVNQRLSTHFLESAEKLTEILSRIEGRTKIAKDRGADVSSVETAITKAKASIAKLIEASEKQKNKVFAVSIQSETTARSDFGKSRKELNSDIEALKALAQQARVDVRKAAVALASIKESQPEVEDTVAPTPSASTSPATTN